ncbi:MAG: YeeE/YedE family protein [Flavobacteriia bacterium]|nr:YeeE/YedE family protein [Flavobacteriia bacterium]
MKNPLAWYIAGPLIGLIVPLLLILREKQFGISSSYRYIGSKIFKSIPYFKYNSEPDKWQLHFAYGLILAGFLTPFWGDFETITSEEANTIYGKISKTIYTPTNILYFFIGGILIGFGTRYANGCTSGHCIMGVSQFSKSSIVATVSFFIGGMIVSYGIIPFIF